MTREQDHRYQSFLLRCWSTESGGSAWRFELRDVSAEPTQHRFTDLTQLVDHLSAELAQQASDPAAVRSVQPNTS